MRTWTRCVLDVLLVVCLSSCSIWSGDTPTPTPTVDQASVDGQAKQQVAESCLDLWVNAFAPQTIRDNGEAMTDSSGGPVDEPVLVREEDGHLHVDTTSRFFDRWITTNDVPWTDIQIALLAGVGCPYDPVVKEKLDQETQDCLKIWVNTQAPRSAIDAGLVTTSPDGIPIQPVLTLSSDGQYQVDILSSNFQVWIADTDDYFVPWDHIYTQTIAGEGCPYGQSRRSEGFH